MASKSVETMMEDEMDDDLSIGSFQREIEEEDPTKCTDPSESRDEVKEIEKATRAETRRLRLWRVVVTAVLLLTALAVTLTTYDLLRKEQQKRFETAVCNLLKLRCIY